MQSSLLNVFDLLDNYTQLHIKYKKNVNFDRFSKSASLKALFNIGKYK